MRRKLGNALAVTLFKIMYHHHVAPEIHGPPFIGAVRKEAQGSETVFFDDDGREVLRLDLAIVRSIEDSAAGPRLNGVQSIRKSAWG
jgi:hypothetical protein